VLWFFILNVICVMLSVVMLSVTMLSVIKVSVVRLNVMSPLREAFSGYYNNWK
jgi:hypothetical protein